MYLGGAKSLTLNHCFSKWRRNPPHLMLFYITECSIVIVFELHTALAAKLIKGSFLLIPWIFSLKAALSQVKGLAQMSKLHSYYKEMSSALTTPTCLNFVKPSLAFFGVCGTPMVWKQWFPEDVMPMKKVWEEEKEMTVCLQLSGNMCVIWPFKWTATCMILDQ